MGQGEQASVEEVLLKVLAWQGEHSVRDAASCPAGHVRVEVPMVISVSLKPLPVSQMVIHVFVPSGGSLMLIQCCRSSGLRKVKTKKTI